MNELPIIASEAEETSEMLQGAGYGPLHHGIEFLRIGTYPASRNYVSQILNCLLAKVAFGELDVKTTLVKASQNLLQMSNMLRNNSVVNQNIVKKKRLQTCARM